MREELKRAFAQEVRERIGVVVAELGLEWVGEVETPGADAARLFEATGIALAG